jgi:hypothetical protein
VSDDVDCPYCGKEQEINHDDGYGFGEDIRYQQECGDCGKTFAFTTSISVDHRAHKADCLNGQPHKLKMSATFPRMYSRMICDDCDYERKPTPEEFSAAGIQLSEN